MRPKAQRANTFWLLILVTNELVVDRENCEIVHACTGNVRV